MENNFNQNNMEEEIKLLAQQKLYRMNDAEKLEYVQKEKKRTFWWLVVSLFCCLDWAISIFYSPNDAIIPLLISIIASLTISIIMIVKLNKNSDYLVLIRIKREINREIKGINKTSQKEFKTLSQLQDDFALSNHIPVLKSGFVIQKELPVLSSGFTNTKFLIDNQHKQFIYVRGKYQSTEYKFTDIIDYEVYENGHSKVKGRAGSALIGGMFFGLTGLIVGSNMSRNVQEKCNQLKLIIRLNDFECPEIIIPYISNADTRKTKSTYRKKITNLQTVCSMLEFMMNNKTLEQSANCKEEMETVTGKTKSNKEQLQELKELLNEGLISEEDFEQKKKQILGL